MIPALRESLQVAPCATCGLHFGFRTSGEPTCATCLIADTAAVSDVTNNDKLHTFASAQALNDAVAFSSSRCCVTDVLDISTANSFAKTSWAHGRTVDANIDLTSDKVVSGNEPLVVNSMIRIFDFIQGQPSRLKGHMRNVVRSAASGGRKRTAVFKAFYNELSKDVSRGCRSREYRGM